MRRKLVRRVRRDWSIRTLLRRVCTVAIWSCSSLVRVSREAAVPLVVEIDLEVVGAWASARFLPFLSSVSGC